MNSVKMQKDMTTETNPQCWKLPSILLEKSKGKLLIVPERMKRLGQRRNEAQLQMYLVVKVKSDVLKNNIT